VSFKKIHIQILLLWLFLVILGLNSRSYLPIDETRYVTVAWNMWLNGDYFVPYLNGVAYSHKPPLLFWLINLGWSFFGVNDWWPRLVPSLFALATVFVTRKIAGRLWPEQITIKDNASLILIGSGLWVLYTTALMFDMMIAFFTALGMWGLLIALQNGGKKGWLLFTLAVGGGLLAKGPTILLQLLPVALLAAWWNINPAKKLKAKNWYLPLFFAVLGGVVIALLWAIPAGMRGGDVYQHAIFWGQTADRMVDSFAHNRPFWWYVPILPLLLFPWLLWGRFWQGIKQHKTPELGVRFCITWALPVFIAFSFISGKQIHYILPIFPAFALLIARFSHVSVTANTRTLVLPITIATALLGAILLALPLYQRTHPSFALWIQDIPLWLGGLIVASAVLIYFLPKKTVANTVAQLSVMTIALVTICMFVLIHAAGDAYDVRPISAQLKILELSNTPVATIGKYPGVFNFIGRLKQSPDIISADQVPAWFTAHPNGRIVEYFKRNKPIDPSQVEYMQAYKGISVAILTRAQWLKLTARPEQASIEQAD
jgi:4-amino-4-deoxy-L-arabinose transferase-like glycosyltransferase